MTENPTVADTANPTSTAPATNPTSTAPATTPTTEPAEWPVLPPEATDRDRRRSDHRRRTGAGTGHRSLPDEPGRPARA